MLLHSPPLFELKTHPQGVVEGYASTFGRIDSYGHTIVSGAYAETLVEHARRGTTPAMLWAHDAKSPVGRWERLQEDNNGLHAAGRLNLKTAGGREAFEHLSAGDVTGLSVGLTVPAGGEDWQGQTRLLLRLNLHEISLVAMPADQSARITSVKSVAQGDKPRTLAQFRDALQQLGFSRREAAAIAQKSFGGFDRDEDSERNTEDRLAIKAALRSTLRTLAIRAAIQSVTSPGNKP